MNIKKWVTIAAFAVATVFAVTACDSGPSEPSGQQQEHDANNAVAKQLVQNQPIPQGNYSQMRQNLIEIEKAEMDGVQTTSFAFVPGNPDPIWSCPSVGAAIPDTASLSNPLQAEEHGQYGDGTIAVGQMDPNGIYTPPSSQGTYVICIGAGGKAYAHRSEGWVDTVFGPAKWNSQTKQEDLIGPPSFNFTTHK